MSFRPILKEWELYFDKNKGGLENRSTVVKAFADFLSDPKKDKLEIPGKCRLGGRVYGRVGFDEGDEIFTSSVRFIEKTEHNDGQNAPIGLLKATTASGTVYYCAPDGYNAYMNQMLRDLDRTGELKNLPHCYLKPEFRETEFI